MFACRAPHAAYVVITKRRTRNQSELELYAKEAASFMAGHSRHAPSVACRGTLARWHASLRQSVFVCRSNAGLTGTRHGTQLPPQEPSDGWLGTRPGQPSLKPGPMPLSGLKPEPKPLEGFRLQPTLKGVLNPNPLDRERVRRRSRTRA